MGGLGEEMEIFVYQTVKKEGSVVVLESISMIGWLEMPVCFGSVVLHHVSITIFTQNQKKLIIDISSLMSHMYFFSFLDLPLEPEGEEHRPKPSCRQLK